MTPQRLNEIKAAWIGKDNNGLAVKGNAAYRMVAELINEVERFQGSGKGDNDGDKHDQPNVNERVGLKGEDRRN